MQEIDKFKITSLGQRKTKSPLKLSGSGQKGYGQFVPDKMSVRYKVEVMPGIPVEDDFLFEKAGPREELFFDPKDAKVAIVTCGGLCPGLNNVIRSATLELFHNYGVKQIFGIRYGFQGLNPEVGKPVVPLTPEFVESIHEDGGSVLGTSRGPQPIPVMVDFLEKNKINILVCIGGDGTHRAAHLIYNESLERGYQLAVVGIPKTIDNDIMYVSRTFGLSTAIQKASEIIDCAHSEAHGAINGIGIVKVMGRDAGFIAAGATLASQEVNFTLVPEVPFSIAGFLEALQKRIEQREHAVIAVAEGAGQNLFKDLPSEKDASGNIKYHDIGIYLKDCINLYFKERKIPVNIRYFDPSYFIRSSLPNCDDAILCDQLARNAVHAVMAGKTDVMIGYWNSAFTHVPISMAIEKKKTISPESELWLSVLAATGQPMDLS